MELVPSTVLAVPIAIELAPLAVEPVPSAFIAPIAIESAPDALAFCPIATLWDFSAVAPLPIAIASSALPLSARTIAVISPVSESLVTVPFPVVPPSAASELSPQALLLLPNAVESTPTAIDWLPKAVELVPTATVLFPQAVALSPSATVCFPQAVAALPKALVPLPQAVAFLPIFLSVTFTGFMSSVISSTVFFLNSSGMVSSV